MLYRSPSQGMVVRLHIHRVGVRGRWPGRKRRRWPQGAPPRRCLRPRKGAPLTHVVPMFSDADVIIALNRYRLLQFQ